MFKLKSGCYSYNCTAEEFLDLEIDEPTGETLSDSDLIDLVQKNNPDGENDCDDDKENDQSARKSKEVYTNQAIFRPQPLCFILDIRIC
ncbi:hypothetical protein BpHYR1_043590 [Brachionus plicatilis]|uniref:Uncharacterized protein n=1 Tax=Brachionus plicatilis TaxID=10195 RepID=A0A3M7T013_BRAPC|nr:hypothetical protein BpHYR1_043590 [Brachionus plicatilis]